MPFLVCMVLFSSIYAWNINVFFQNNPISLMSFICNTKRVISYICTILIPQATQFVSYCPISTMCNKSYHNSGPLAIYITVLLIVSYHKPAFFSTMLAPRHIPLLSVYLSKMVTTCIKRNEN